MALVQRVITIMIGVCVLGILSGCLTDLRPNVAPLPIPLYPLRQHEVTGIPKKDWQGFPYESTTFDTPDTATTVIDWYRHQLTGTGWEMLNNSTDQALNYYDNRGCPHYELWITVMPDSTVTHVEVAFTRIACRGVPLPEKQNPEQDH
jgi:hypothetical protein